MSIIQRAAWVSAVGVSIVVGGGASVAQAGDVRLGGAGATFPAPLYTKWVSEYEKVEPGVKIDYRSIGSGGGVKAITDKTVAFGASDAPLTKKEIEAMGGEDKIVQFPAVIGGVVPAYNVPGLTQPSLRQLLVDQAAGVQRIGQARRQPAGGHEIRRGRTRGALPACRAGQAAPQAREIGFVGTRVAGLDGQMKRTFGAQQGRVRWFVARFARMAEAEQPGAQQVGADALEAAAQQGVEPLLEFAGPQRVGDQQGQAERRVARGDERDLGPVRRLRGQQAQDGGCTVRQRLEFEGTEGGRQHAVAARRNLATQF